MGILEIIFIALGLSMDAFAVAVCLGLKMQKATVKKALIVGLYFGLFQAGMPLLGYLAAKFFADKIVAFDHWIAFALLVFLGTKMALGSMKKEENQCADSTCRTDETSLHYKEMLPFAFATSIDALAVGVSLAFLQANIFSAVAIIGAITLAMSMAGVKIGNIFGTKIKSHAELAGGIILILMGIKILLEHLL